MILIFFIILVFCCVKDEFYPFADMIAIIAKFRIQFLEILFVLQLINMVMAITYTINHQDCH